MAITNPNSPPVATRTSCSSLRARAAGACSRKPKIAIDAAMKPAALAASLTMIDPTGSTRRA